MHVHKSTKKIILLTATTVLLSLFLAAPVFAEGEPPIEEPPMEEAAPGEELPEGTDTLSAAVAVPDAEAGRSAESYLHPTAPKTLLHGSICGLI